MANQAELETATRPVLERIERRIGNMRIRLKLMVFHNVFFCLLALTIYLSIIPVLESRLDAAYQREIQVLQALLASPMQDPRNLSALKAYEQEQGSAAQLGMPEEVRRWVDEHPGEVWHSPGKSVYLYHKDRSIDVYQRVRLPRETYRKMLSDARWAVTLVLLATYVLGVLVLEFIVLPLYVYRPIRMLLDADRASTSGDREHEFVEDGSIPDDELGDLMRSRNQTIRGMRDQERQLAEALEQLREVTTDLTRKNHQLEAARQNLLDQDRLASLGLISASVAHELNTPLAVLRGSIQKMVERAPDAASRERLQRMERVTDRLRAISSQLLDFATVRRTECMAVPVRSLIADCWQLVSIDDKAQQVTLWNEAGPDVAVSGNPDRLGQVFVNLLRNALHAINVSGNIWVHTGLDATDPQRVVIRVEDDGPGIAESLLPHLFDAFVSTRLDSHGTGLGLTVAEGIVQQHGGTIRAYNRSAGGACLEVGLPLAPGQSGAIAGTGAGFGQGSIQEASAGAAESPLINAQP